MPRKCLRCLQTQSPTEFNSTSNLCATCREPEQIKLHKERKKERKKEWRSANKEHINERIKEWRSANKEHMKEYMKEYRSVNKEHINERIKEWRSANKEHMKEYEKERRRNILIATPPWVTDAHKALIRLLRQQSTSMTESTGIQHSLDHIIPINNTKVSGLHVWWNLELMTASENSAKGARLADCCLIEYGCNIEV